MYVISDFFSIFVFPEENFSSRILKFNTLMGKSNFRIHLHGTVFKYKFSDISVLHIYQVSIIRSWQQILFVINRKYACLVIT